MASISLLNLDQSFPDADPRTGATNNAGVIRFIDSADDNTLDVMNRFSGDLVKRFLLDETKINELAGVLNSNPQLGTFDNTPYVLTDGSHAFTAVVSGVAPTLAAHLATKGYTDAQLASTNAVLQALSGTVTGLGDTLPTVSRSGFIEFVWSGGTPQVVDLIVAPTITNLDKVVSITVMEKLDIAQPTTTDPNPDPIWVYRQLQHGTCGDGLRVDDIWLVDNLTVRVLIPSTSSYSPGYSATSNYGAVANPRQRFLSAVVTESGV